MERTSPIRFSRMRGIPLLFGLTEWRRVAPIGLNREGPTSWMMKSNPLEQTIKSVSKKGLQVIMHQKFIRRWISKG